MNGGGSGWRRNAGNQASEDPFLRALRSRVAWVRAPESLRARIGAMLAAERARVRSGEPEDGSAR